jgi:hypothetical protein
MGRAVEHGHLIASYAYAARAGSQAAVADLLALHPIKWCVRHEVGTPGISHECGGDPQVAHLSRQEENGAMADSRSTQEVTICLYELTSRRAFSSNGPRSRRTARTTRVGYASKWSGWKHDRVIYSSNAANGEWFDVEERVGTSARGGCRSISIT